jgi:predicted dehydrogenase
MSSRLLTRRELIETLAAAAAGAPLLRDLQPEKKLGWALVGLGSLSTNQIAPALEKTRRCRLAAVVTGTPAKGERWKARYRLPDRAVYSYQTMARLADDPDVDVVYVVTPNALHMDHAIAAARAGKHVFCEKPMEVSTERCERMIAECRKAGKQLGIAYRLQFEPHHLECVRLARTKAFGPVRRVDARLGFAIGDPRQWRLDRELAGGGPLMDVGIYALQAARMMTGEEPVSVTATEAPKRDPVKFREVEEAIDFRLRFPSGAVAECRTTYVANGMNDFTVTCERGSFGMRPAFTYDGLKGWRSDGKPLAFDAPDQFAAEMDAFAESILDGRKTTVPGEEGLRDVRIMMGIYESARSGRAVRL